MAGAFNDIQREVSQDHCLRKPLLRNIQKLRSNRAVVSFFISFYSRAPLSHEDADMIEEVLCNTDTSSGVTLILDAPGGDGLAAERIIQICRKYSKKDFETIVPARAKSAATMVCLGSDRILMSPVSELGPIDPQIPIKTGETWQWVAAHHVVKTYETLMKEAVGLQQGHIEPFLQQLAQFNSTQIEILRSATKLAEHIAVTSLQKGMLRGKTETEIREKIRCFTDPDITLAHGRALNIEHLSDSGLSIEETDLRSGLWQAVRRLYVRSKYVVDRGETGRKIVDTIQTSYRAA